MNKIRLVFNRTGWDGFEVMWTEVKTVEIELPFDNPERGDFGKGELVGGEWLVAADDQTGGTERKEREEQKCKPLEQLLEDFE